MATKEKKPAAPKEHPPFKTLVGDAILELKDRQGSTAKAITKAIGEGWSVAGGPVAEVPVGAMLCWTVPPRRPPQPPPCPAVDKWGSKIKGGVTGVDKLVATQLKRLVANGFLTKPNAARFKLSEIGKKEATVRWAPEGPLLCGADRALAARQPSRAAPPHPTHPPTHLLPALGAALPAGQAQEEGRCQEGKPSSPPLPPTPHRPQRSTN